MIGPLLAAGYIWLTPKFLRALKEIKEFEKYEKENRDVDMYRLAVSQADSPKQKRRVEATRESDWKGIRDAAQQLIKSKNLKQHVVGKPILAAELDDLKRMQGFVRPEEMLVREIEQGVDDLFDYLVIEGRRFRPNHKQDLIAFGQFINRKLDEGNYDGLDINSPDGEGWFRLYVDWWQMLGHNLDDAEELAYSGEKPWYDLNANRLGLTG